MATAVKEEKKKRSKDVSVLIKWRTNPLAWVKDIFGENLRKEFKSYTGKEPLTETGLTKQQETALKELGKIIRAKLLAHKGAELTKVEKEYASKIGISIQSGTGTGKDFFAALVMLYMLHSFHNCREAATANSAKQLRNVLWATISKVMALANKVDPSDPTSPTILQYLFEWQSERVYLKEKKGQTWFAEASTISARSSEEEQGVALGGRHEKYMLLVADEASGIPDGVFRPLEGTLTGPVNLLLVIFNPTRSTGFAIDSQKDERFVALRWNSEESEIVTEAHIAGFAKYGRDSNTYRIRILGLPPLADSNTLIPWDWIENARSRSIQSLEEDFIVKSCDFGAGGDKSIIATKKGGNIYGFKRSNTKDSNELTDWVYGDALRDEADMLLGDSVGIGWAVMGNLRKRYGGFRVRSVDSREKAIDPERFFNKRAEMYWNLRTAFEEKEISLEMLDDVDYKELSDQLGAITYSDDSGRIQIVKKSKIKDEIGHSPDEADALAIGYAIPTAYLRKHKPDAYEEDYSGSRNLSWMSA